MHLGPEARMRNIPEPGTNVVALLLQDMIVMTVQYYVERIYY